MNHRHLAGQIAAFAMLLAACAGGGGIAPSASVTPAVGSVASTPAESNAPVSPSSLPELGMDGPIAPGRYRYVVDNACDDPACPLAGRPPAPLGIEITVPAGYTTFDGFPVIAVDSASGTNGPDGGALVLGWTSFWVGLNSDPCLDVGHEPTDIAIGPTVDDFVNAVVAHPELDVTEPRDVELGGYHGRFFSLTGPSDISGCDNWRPWDPGFFVQGPDNMWDVWIMDVEGFRVLIVNEYFPETSDDIKAELRAMAESIRFVP